MVTEDFDNDGDKDIITSTWDGGFNPEEDLDPSWVFNVDPVWSPGSKDVVADSLCKAMFRNATSYLYNEQYVEAKSIYESLIQQYPSNRYALLALKRLFQITSVTTQNYQMFKTYCQNLSIYNNDNLSELAEYLIIKCEIKLGLYNNAIIWLENEIENPETASDSLFAMLDLGNLLMSIPDSTRISSKYADFDFNDWESFHEFESATIHNILTRDDNPEYSPIPTAITAFCYPNPIKFNTTISLKLLFDTNIEVAIYNVKGQQVKSLYKGEMKEGNREIYWDGIDNHGQRVSSGLYFYMIQSDQSKQLHKMLMIK